MEIVLCVCVVFVMIVCSFIVVLEVWEDGDDDIVLINDVCLSLVYWYVRFFDLVGNVVVFLVVRVDVVEVRC